MISLFLKMMRFYIDFIKLFDIKQCKTKKEAGRVGLDK